MKAKIKHYIKEIFLFTLFITIIANVMSLYKSQSLSHEPLRIKEFCLLDNTLATLDPSKPILIHFWATWCPVCKAEIDNIQRVSKYYDVVTIAVNSGSDYDIHQYMKGRDLNFKVVNDKESKLAQKLKIAVYPTTFIYNKDKELVFSEVGYTSSFGLFLRMFWASLS